MSANKQGANNKPNNKKRTKDEASPGSISDQPDKCSRASNPSPTQLSSVPEVPSTPVYQTVGPYFPPHLRYVVQHHQQGIVPGYGVASPIPLSTSGSPVASPPSAANDSNFLTILHKLESIECKLVKLDQIESDVGKISKNVTRVEARMCIMETNFSKLETKFNDIETSRQFDSQECHDLKVKLSEFQGQLSTELAQMATLKTEILDLKSNNVSLSNDLLDLKSRSMRDNLLFFNSITSNYFRDHMGTIYCSLILKKKHHLKAEKLKIVSINS